MRRALTLVLVAVLLLPARIGLAQGDPGENPIAPATGAAAVVAQGVSGLPADDVIWIAQTLTADQALGPVQVGGPGFVVADKAAVMLTDANGGVSLLARGETAFVPAAGAEVAALGEKADAFKLISISDASVDADDVLFAGLPFAAPEGDRDINLVRVVLKADEDAEIANGEAPAAVLVLKGSVTVENEDGNSVKLTAGKAGQQSGDLVVTSTGTLAATVLIAVIGSELDLGGGIGAQSTTAPTPTQPVLASGSITYVTYLCPDVDNVADATTTTCNATSDLGPGYFSLSGGRLDGAQGPSSMNGVWGWSGLAPGPYALNLVTYPDGYDSMAIDVVPGVSRSGDSISVSLPAEGSVSINIYLFKPSAGSTPGGTALVGVSLYECPVGSSVDPDELDATVCTDVDSFGSYTLTLTDPALGVDLGVADMVEIQPQPSLGGDYQWQNLAAGTYTVTASSENPEDAFVMVHACGDPSGCNPVTQFDPASGSFDLADGQTFLLVIYRIPAE